MAAATTVESFLPVQNRVLIASADPLFRKSLMNNAIYSDAHCEEAVGGALALAKLKHIACDNVLLDLNLPDLDSSELARLIVKRYPQIKVGFIDSQMTPPAPYELVLDQQPALDAASFGTAFLESRVTPQPKLFVSPERAARRNDRFEPGHAKRDPHPQFVRHLCPGKA